MKKYGFIPFLLLTGGLSVPSGARDLYAYRSGSYSPVQIVNDIQKISFSGTQLTLTSASGDVGSYALSDVDYFRFSPTPIPVGIAAREVPSAVRFDGKALHFPRHGVRAVEVYSVTGLLASRALLSGESSLDVTTLQPGLYVARIFTADGETMYKFVKP